MAHLVHWDFKKLEQDAGSKRAIEMTTPQERLELKHSIEAVTEMLQTVEELRVAGSQPNAFTIANGRKFHIQWLVGDQLEGRPGYYILNVYIFRRMN